MWVPLLPYWYTPLRAEAFSNTSTLITNDPHLYRRKPTALIPLVGRIQEGNTREISNNENGVNPNKRITSPSTQNLKALGLRVFFLICCSTFSFLPNVGLRLTLEYLTNWILLLTINLDNQIFIFIKLHIFLIYTTLLYLISFSLKKYNFFL